MDARQERGQRLAQDTRLRRIEGTRWYIPSESGNGGYLVDLAPTMACSCADFTRHGVKCKHIWAAMIARDRSGALAFAEDEPKTAKVIMLHPPDRPQVRRAGRAGLLTAEEKINVLAALRFLRTRHGSWALLAKAILLKRDTLEHVAHGRAPSVELAFRVARCAGVPVDDVLGGRFPPPGACPHCGHVPAA